MDNDRIIKNIQKSSLELIRVALREFKNSRFLDIRNFYDADGKGKQFLPTRKGIAVSLELLPDLLEAIKKAIESVESWKAENE